MPTPASDDLVLSFGIFELNTVTGELRKRGMTVKLRPQAARVLSILVTRRGQLVSREELRELVWGRETFVDFEHGLNLCIQQIRAALDDDAGTPRYIETLPRRGYRFIMPAGGTAEGTPLPRPPAHVAKSGFPSSPLSAAILFSSLLAIGIVMVAANAGGLRERIFGRSGPVRTIAVLPLQNLTGDPAQDYFADGMTDALTTNLARMEQLQVISRTSAMQYKAANKPLPTIAQELGADAIVEGSVQRSGNHVRITAQLVRARTDRHLWAETYERDLKDILALQDEIASAIAREIEMRLHGPKAAPLQKTAAVSPQAYETYLKANYYLDRFDLQKSIEYYSEAIKLDPGYAPTYAHMAQAYFFLAFFDSISPREGWGKVKEAAALAVQKDDLLPEGHGALALAKLHYDWDFAGAEQEFKRALGLNPNDADIRHEYAHYLMAVGRVAESEAESRRAVELDPVGDALSSCLCWHSFAAGDYDQSVRLARKFLSSQPNDPWEHTILGWTYEQKQMPDQAISEFKSAVAVTKGDPFFLAALGHAYAVVGRKREADEVLHNLFTQAHKSYISPFGIALIYTALGEKDMAFRWLDKAVSERSTFLVYSKWEPRLAPLRSDPRFKELLDRIGLGGQPLKVPAS